MKFSISVELSVNGKPLEPKDLRGLNKGFLKAAPKALRRAIRAALWQFDTSVSIEIEEPPTKKPRKRT